jgi:hypothetical protein
MTPIPSSTAPAARQWIYDQCSALLTPDPLSPSSSLLVCFDEPGPNQPDDIVSVGAVSRAFEPGSFVAGGGAGWLKERYTITVSIDVFRGGDDAQATYTRAQVLADGVIAAVRSDLTLGGAVITATPLVDSSQGEWDQEHLGRHVTSTIEISCLAYI